MQDDLFLIRTVLEVILRIFTQVFFYQPLVKLLKNVCTLDFFRFLIQKNNFAVTFSFVFVQYAQQNRLGWLCWSSFTMNLFRVEFQRQFLLCQKSVWHYRKEKYLMSEKYFTYYRTLQSELYRDTEKQLS